MYESFLEPRPRKKKLEKSEYDLNNNYYEIIDFSLVFGRSAQDLNSQTRDRTQAPYSGSAES